ncbi:MAG: hypothetical protein J6D42_07130 [Clostridia bacterium]|nr:hypothetical protein [Clostridia bacterium]
MKKNIVKILCFLMIFSITISNLTVYVPASAATEGYQAGYTFDDAVNLKWDLGGKYPLVEYDFSPFEALPGKNGNAVSAYFALDPAMFSGLSEMTLGFWFNFSEISFDTQLFYIGNGNETYPYLSLDYSPDSESVSLKIYDGRNTETIVADVSSEVFLGGWHHIAFTYDITGLFYRLNIYINGFSRNLVNTDVTIDNLSNSNVIFFSDFVLDELYISNLPLSADNVMRLSSMTLADFFTYMGEDIHDTVPDIPIEEEEPDEPSVDPDEPDDPLFPWDEPSDEDEIWTPPTNLDRIKFSWLAYTFDNTYDMSRDLNKTTSAIINEFTATKVATGTYNGLFGYGLTRRTEAVPDQYLKLDPGLLYQADSFTFCAWVYRSADKQDQFYDYSQMKLLDFTGYGKFEFSPFITTEISPEKLFELFPPELPSVEEELPEEVVEPDPEVGPDGGVTDPSQEDLSNMPFGPVKEEKVLIDLDVENKPVFVFGTDKNFPTTNDLSKTNLKSVNNKWVHYAVTYSTTGEVKIYVNGTLTDTFYTGQPFSSLQITNFKILSGSSSIDPSKYFIDEIYLSSRVLDASDIRKIKTYGISRFTTEVLPDPAPDNSNTETTEPEISDVDLRPDDTDTLEDSYSEKAQIHEFIGTTFDDTSLIGKDYNNSVIAVIRNASLSQGIKNYGLTLDGINSYIRYPIGILDDANELTISICYNWAGNTSSVNQKLMYFANKESSVAKPKAYMLFDMGNGTDGLSFEISDGSVKTTLVSDTAKTNEWVRVTVTIKDGTAKLYINGALVDSASTSLDPASVASNYNYIGKSGVKGEPLFKGIVDEIYISPIALSAQEIQAFEEYGIEPYIPVGGEIDIEEPQEDLWDSIINGVVIATGVLIFIIIIVIIVTIFKK